MGNQRALDLRNTLVDLVKGIVDRERPKPRVAMVYSFNRFNRFADVLLTGDDQPIAARFPKHLQPTRQMTVDLDDNDNPIGDMVLVEGTVNNYRITQIIEGDMFSQGTKLGDAELWGGVFMHEHHAKYFGLSTDLPPEGQSIQIGRWQNPDAELYNHGSAFVHLIIHQPFFAIGRKEYRIPIQGYDTAGVWQNVYPDKDGGIANGNQFELEIKSDGNGFDLRIRNVQQNDTFTPSGYVYNMWVWGERFEHDPANFNVVDASAAPTVAFRTDVVANTEVNNDAQQGPFFDSVRHLIQVRAWQNISGGGTVNWASNRLKWSTDLDCPLCVTRLATSGRIAIPMPAVSSTIFTHGITGQTTTTVSSTGIDMRPGGSISWSVLYYEANLGSSTGNAGKYHVVGNDVSFHVPSHWIQLAAADFTEGTLSWAAGGLIYIDPTSWYQANIDEMDTTNTTYGPGRAWWDPKKKWIEVELYLARITSNSATNTIHSPVVVPSPYQAQYRVNLPCINNIGGTEDIVRMTMLKNGETNAGRMDIVFATTRVWSTTQFAMIKGGWATFG